MPNSILSPEWKAADPVSKSSTYQRSGITGGSQLTVPDKRPPIHGHFFWKSSLGLPKNLFHRGIVIA